jgi:hypothetical protein
MEGVAMAIKKYSKPLLDIVVPTLCNKLYTSCKLSEVMLRGIFFNIDLVLQTF